MGIFAALKGYLTIMTPIEENGWHEWGKHVLSELKRLNVKVEKVNDATNQIKVEIGQLKVKSGVFGAIGASIPVLTGLIIYFVSIIINHID